MTEERPQIDRLWRNARLATLKPGAPGLGLVEAGVLATSGGRIAFAGAEADLPGEFRKPAESVDCGGRLITPGPIDCHTHLIFGGNRAHEFEMRREGRSYEEIARAGGGILSTVEATRALSEEALAATALPRLDALIEEGVCTVEIKSGYGLTVADELKMLSAARSLEKRRAVRIRTSYLAAHAVPQEYADRADAYVDDIVLPGMDAVRAAGLADAVDGFCEGIAFSPEQIARVFDKAKALGLPIKLHAEQLSNLGGARLAASYGALSADHLEYLDIAGARALAAAGSVAVLLPGAFYTLGEKHVPPVAALREAGVPMAVATDCNPGTSPVTSLQTMMNMAATLFGLSVEECVAGVTREAARALGAQDETGTLEAGKSADFVVWDVENPAELVYWVGLNPLHRRIFQGEGPRP